MNKPWAESVEPDACVRRRKPYSIIAAALAKVSFVLAVAWAPVQAGAADFATHRALYDLVSVGTARGLAIESITGKAVSDTINACDRWTSEQTMRLEVTSSEGQSRIYTFHSRSEEAKDGLSYRFEFETELDGTVVDRTRGRARLNAAGGAGFAEFEEPERRRIELPAGTMFPMQHLAQILAEAAGGKRPILTRTIFSGEEPEVPLYLVTATLGKRRLPSTAEARDPFLAHPSWTIQMSFYEPEDPSPLASYDFASRVFANGVTGELTFDFDQVKVHGRLRGVQNLPKPKC